MFPTDSPIVLIADDSEDDLMMTARFVRLVMPNARVVRCSDGQQTVDCLLEFVNKPIGDLPSLVILDLKMPKLNGDEVMERMRNERSLAKVPIVLFSSSALPEDVERCMQAGVKSYVRKPTDFDEFRKVIQSICMYWLQTNMSLPSAVGIH